jgi:hypothetical protein
MSRRPHKGSDGVVGVVGLTTDQVSRVEAFIDKIRRGEKAGVDTEPGTAFHDLKVENQKLQRLATGGGSEELDAIKG